jgi:hypothetical protein
VSPGACCSRFTSRGHGVSCFLGRGTGSPARVGIGRVALLRHVPHAPGVRNARVNEQDAPAKQASTRATVKNRQLTIKTPRTRAAKRQQLRAHERVRGHAGRLSNAKPWGTRHQGQHQKRVRDMTHRAKARKIANCKNLQAVPIPFPPERRGQGTIAFLIASWETRENLPRQSRLSFFFAHERRTNAEPMHRNSRYILRALPAILR